jgi:hypothetical protein
MVCAVNPLDLFILKGAAGSVKTFLTIPWPLSDKSGATVTKKHEFATSSG